MTSYRKKPVVIEAVEVRSALLAASRQWDGLPEWLRQAYETGKVVFLADGVLIATLEGNMSAGLDDWIIQGIQGELYPCKPDIFEATYEPVR